jgi:hypothetical protein
LAQELPEQSQLTVADVATIIDDMHGVVDPCQNTRDDDSYFALPEMGTSLEEHQQQYLQEKYSSTSSLENLAEKFGGSCAVKQGEAIKFEVYAFWTNYDIADNYKLICPVGRLDNQRQVQSRFRLRIEVSNASAIDFSYFVLERAGFPAFKNLEWIGGNVVDQYGRAKSIPDPQWDRGGRLYWSESIRSGHIFVEFDTIYDRWDCTLQGVWTSGKRDYNATVTAIWAGNPVSLSLEVPDAGAEESEPCQENLNDAEAVDLSVPSNEPPESEAEPVDPGQDDKCYQVTITDYYHPCTGDYIRSGETQVPAPCDGFDDLDGPNPPVIYNEAFIGAGDPDYEAGRDCGGPCTAAEYEELCCRPPDESYCVPTCLQVQSKNLGGLLPVGGMDALKQEYGDDVQVVWVYPEDGDCGVHTDKLILPDDCCVNGDIVIDTDNSAETVSPSSDALISWTGGQDKITFEVAGQGFWLNQAFSVKKQQQGNDHSVTVYTDSGNCGTGTLSFDDGCSTTSWEIRSTAGSWQLDSVTPYPPGECPGQTGETDGCISGGTRQTRTVCAITGYSTCQADLEDNPEYRPFAGGQLCDTDGISPAGTGKVWCYTVKINTYKWGCDE